MKNRILFSALLLACSFFMLNGQAAISNGKIVLEVSEVKADDPAVKQVLSGSSFVLQSKDNIFRSSTRMMGNQIVIDEYHDLDAKDKRIYLNLMGTKIATVVPADVQEQKLKEANENSIVSYDREDTKEINGFTCHKAVVETLQKDGSVMVMELYVTLEVAFPQYLITGLPQSLEGFPLEYTVKNAGTEVTYVFKEYSEEVDETFNSGSEGYQEMDYEEFMAGIGAQLGL